MNRREFIASTAIGMSGLYGIKFPKFTKESKFLEFANKNFRFNDPTKGIISFTEINPKQYIELANIYENNNNILVKKYRQGGFTTFSICWALYNCITNPDYNCLFVSKTDRCSRFINSRIRNIIDLMANKPDLAKVNNHYIKFDNGNYLRSIGSILKYSYIDEPNCIIFDECAFISNFESIYWKYYSRLKHDGQAIMVSTPYSSDDYFYKTYKQALDGKNNYKAYSPSYLDNPVYTKKFIADQYYMLGPKGFKQEILAEFS